MDGQPGTVDGDDGLEGFLRRNALVLVVLVMLGLGWLGLMVYDILGEVTGPVPRFLSDEEIDSKARGYRERLRRDR